VLVHHFTVDVEEVFHSTLLTDRIPEHQWDDHARRAPGIVSWILDEMAAVGARATFFVIGWLAEREPAMVRQISAAGHEIGAHSWWHRKVSVQNPESFRQSARRTKELLEQLSGTPVTGFRAPSFSIDPGCEWAFDVLLEEGYRYDSSLFPISIHPAYGYPGGGIDPHWIEREGGDLVEVPPLTLGALGRRLPAAGGAYWRLLPLGLTRRALRQAEARGSSGTLYVHPWDLDVDLPRLDLPTAVRLRLYTGAKRAREGFHRLLEAFPSRPIGDTVRQMIERRGDE
jgi:polysaccharide deacetylase family protein (PEP-CTERM system associated)